MNISVSEASKRWGISRTTIYKKIDDDELLRNSDKKIYTTGMLQVFGKPPNTERTEQNKENVQRTPVNSESEQENVQLKHQLEMEELKNVHLQQQVDYHKQLIESYPNLIQQLNTLYYLNTYLLFDKVIHVVHQKAHTKELKTKSQK